MSAHAILRGTLNPNGWGSFETWFEWGVSGSYDQVTPHRFSGTLEQSFAETIDIVSDVVYNFRFCAKCMAPEPNINQGGASFDGTLRGANVSFSLDDTLVSAEGYRFSKVDGSRITPDIAPGQSVSFDYFFADAFWPWAKNDVCASRIVKAHLRMFGPPPSEFNISKAIVPSVGSGTTTWEVPTVTTGVSTFPARLPDPFTAHPYGSRAASAMDTIGPGLADLSSTQENGVFGTFPLDLSRYDVLAPGDRTFVVDTTASTQAVTVINEPLNEPEPRVGGLDFRVYVRCFGPTTLVWGAAFPSGSPLVVPAASWGFNEPCWALVQFHWSLVTRSITSASASLVTSPTADPDSQPLCRIPQIARGRGSMSTKLVSIERPEATRDSTGVLERWPAIIGGGWAAGVLVLRNESDCGPLYYDGSYPTSGTESLSVQYQRPGHAPGFTALQTFDLPRAHISADNNGTFWLHQNDSRVVVNVQWDGTKFSQVKKFSVPLIGGNAPTLVASL